MFKELDIIAEVLCNSIFGIDAEDIIDQRKTTDVSENSCKYTLVYSLLNEREKEVWDAVLATAIHRQIKTGENIIKAVTKIGEDITQHNIHAGEQVVKEIQEVVMKAFKKAIVDKEDLLKILGMLNMLEKLWVCQLPKLEQKIQASGIKKKFMIV